MDPVHLPYRFFRCVEGNVPSDLGGRKRCEESAHRLGSKCMCVVSNDKVFDLPDGKARGVTQA